jgi:hypothetical protein
MKISLNNNYFYTNVKYDNTIYYTDLFLKLINDIPNDTHPLSGNYSLKKINQMDTYGYVTNADGEIVYMSGIERFSEYCYRIESRTYVPPKFRKKVWRCSHGYEAVKYQMNNFKNPVSMWFKSREAKNNFSNLSYAHRYDGFSSGWKVHKHPIELKWKDNYQWIYYNICDNMNIDTLINSMTFKEN